ncbi:MAG: hypothetical protein AB7I40_23210 [Nocardioides sp.]
MNDEDLDVLLGGARQGVSESTAALGRLVAVEAAQTHGPGARSRPRWLRVGVLAPAGIGILALTGAGTLAAYQLSVPPFVSTEPGVERVTDPIPVNYTTDAGTVLECGVWLEFRNVSDAQRANLNAMATDPRWEGFGQRVYDALPEKNRAVQDGPEPLWSERVDDQVYAEALRANPGLAFRGPADGPSLVGSTTRCEYPGAER